MIKGLEYALSDYSTESTTKEIYRNNKTLMSRSIKLVWTPNSDTHRAVQNAGSGEARDSLIIAAILGGEAYICTME